MAKDQDVKPAPTPAKSAEDAEIEKMLAEEAAKAKADAEANAARVDALNKAAPPPVAAVVVAPSAGRCKVRCLKNEPSVVRGHERYSLVMGKEIEMDASHAADMERQGWVLRFQLEPGKDR